MKKQKPQQGDIFSVKASNSEFIFGRILLNGIDYWKKYGNEKPDNYLDWFSNSILIETSCTVAETFDEKMLSKIAVKSSFIDADTFAEDDWKLVEINIPVKPEEISFPEVLRSVERDIYFSAGESNIKTSLDLQTRDEIGVYPSVGSGYWEFIATLDCANRKDLIEYPSDILENYFADSDLRSLPEIRNKIYKDIHLNPEKSYYELATELGIDLGRLF